MTVQNLTLPPDVQSFVAEQMQVKGHTNVNDFVVEIIRQAKRAQVQAERDFGAPEHLRIRSRADLEAKLLEGIESLDRGKGIPVTAEFWPSLRDEIRQRFGVDEQP